MYNTFLKVGQQVSSYVDYKEEIEYEGEVVLLERKATGDTFFLAEEFVSSNPLFSDKPNRRRELINEKLNAVFDNLNEQTKDAKKFHKEILLKKTGRINDYNNMMLIVLKWKDLSHKKYIMNQYDNDDRFKRILREISADYIVRYFQQLNTSTNNSIFKYEKWRVEFIIDKEGYPCSYTAVRNIRVLVKNNYKEVNGGSELSNYMTYNMGRKSSFKKQN